MPVLSEKMVLFFFKSNNKSNICNDLNDILNIYINNDSFILNLFVFNDVILSFSNINSFLLIISLYFYSVINHVEIPKSLNWLIKKSKESALFSIILSTLSKINNTLLLLNYEIILLVLSDIFRFSNL